MSHNYELHQVLSKAFEPRLGNCRDQENVDPSQNSLKTGACRGLKKFVEKNLHFLSYPAYLFSQQEHNIESCPQTLLINKCLVTTVNSRNL